MSIKRLCGASRTRRGRKISHLGRFNRSTINNHRPHWNWNQQKMPQIIEAHRYWNDFGVVVVAVAAAERVNLAQACFVCVLCDSINGTRSSMVNANQHHFPQLFAHEISNSNSKWKLIAQNRKKNTRRNCTTNHPHMNGQLGAMQSGGWVRRMRRWQGIVINRRELVNRQ